MEFFPIVYEITGVVFVLCRNMCLGQYTNMKDAYKDKENYGKIKKWYHSNNCCLQFPSIILSQNITS